MFISTPTLIVSVQVFLRAGANVGACTENGRVPTHCAVASGVVDTVRVLIEAGADRNKLLESFDTDRSDIYTAASVGQVEMVEYLLAHGLTDPIS